MDKKISIARGDSVVIHAVLKSPAQGRSIRSAPLIVFVHGFPKMADDNHRLFDLAAETLADNGFHCLKFDFACCTGKEADAEKFTLDDAQHDFDAVFQWARNNRHTRLAFVTEGLGAALVYKNMPAQTAFNILCWPALDLSHALKRYDTQLQEHGVAGSVFGAQFKMELQALDLDAILEQEDLPPTLILHGDKDDLLPPQIHLEYARKHLMARRIDITSFDDGTHGLPNPAHQRVCVQHIVGFALHHQEESPADKAVRLERAKKILAG